jgi:hypothetical protein
MIFYGFGIIIETLFKFWDYSGFETKLSPIFGFAKSSQIQNQLPIKPNAQIRCSSCYSFGLSVLLSFNFYQFDTVFGISKTI